jgi:hypothetical protein
MSTVKTNVGSAIRFTYFLVFLFATANVLLTGWGTYMPREWGQIMRGHWDILTFPILIPVFILAVSLHGLRLYLTLEMLEDKHPPFDNYLENLTGWRRDLEFFTRVAIVLVVTYKAGTWGNLSDVLLYLVLLYTALMVWSTVGVVFLGLGWKQSYFKMSFIGCAASYLLYFLPRDDTHLSLLFVSFFIYTILHTLLADFRENKMNYCNFLTKRIPARMKGQRHCDAELCSDWPLIRAVLLMLIAGVTLWYSLALFRKSDPADVYGPISIFGLVLLLVALCSSAKPGRIFDWTALPIAFLAFTFTCWAPPALGTHSSLQLIVFGSSIVAVFIFTMLGSILWKGWSAK